MAQYTIRCAKIYQIGREYLKGGCDYKLVILNPQGVRFVTKYSKQVNIYKKQPYKITLRVKIYRVEDFCHTGTSADCCEVVTIP